MKTTGTTALMLALHARVEELEAMLDAVGAGGVSAQRVTQAKDHIAQDRKMVAQEPFGYFKAEPFGWRDCAETDEGAIALYEAPQPQEDALDAVNIDRLGKALTKLGHAAWVSQEEAAADIPRWVNALTSCVLEIPEAAPQPQADARAVEQPRLTVRLTSFPESNGKRNWTAMFVRAEPWDGLIGNAGGITIKHGELWNRVAYEAERARFLIGERDTEPYILDYIADIQTPDAWTGESLALSRQQRRFK